MKSSSKRFFFFFLSTTLITLIASDLVWADWKWFQPRQFQQLKVPVLENKASPGLKPHFPDLAAPPLNVGDTSSATGKVIRILITWNDNTTTPCMAVIRRDSDQKAFEAFVRVFDDEGLKKYAASALCDTLINAFESQKTVVVAGEIEELGVTGAGGHPLELGNLKVNSVNYFTGAVDWEDTPTGDALRNSEVIGGVGEPPPCNIGDKCSGHGTVTRILNWANNSTTLCMAILKTTDAKTIEAFVRQPTNYGNLSDISKAMVAHSMLKACHALSEALSAQKTGYVAGTLEEGGSLKTDSVNILQVEGQWGNELPSAF